MNAGGPGCKPKRPSGPDGAIGGTLASNGSEFASSVVACQVLVYDRVACSYTDLDPLLRSPFLLWTTQSRSQMVDRFMDKKVFHPQLTLGLLQSLAGLS
jgi:hypothetical protein